MNQPSGKLPGKWPQFTLRQLMVVMLLICAVLAIGVPIYRSVLEQERQWMCQNNLKMIGVALHTYHDTWQCLPAASRTDASGNPSLSWRVAILPMLEGAPLYDHYTMTEPRNGP